MRSAAACMALAAALLAVSGSRAQDGEARAMAEAVLQVSAAGDELRYDAEIWVPDPCYRAVPAASAEQRGDALVLQVQLVREPGICATVMTRQSFGGTLPLPDPRPRELRLEFAMPEPQAGPAASLAAEIPP